MSEHRGAPAPLRLLAGVLLPARDREFIMGDLDELYLRRTAREGRGSATRRYLRDALLSAAARFFGRRRHRRAARPAGPRRRDPTVAGSALLMDVRWALRTLRRERGFAALVVLTLALGIGSTSAVFGMVNQLLLRPLAGAAHSPSAAYLQFHSPERPEGTNGHGLAQPDFDALRRETDWLAGIASYGLVGLRVSVDDARPVAVLGNAIYGDFFEVLGVRPSAGRLLAAAETEIDAEPLQAVIAGELAGTLFGSAAAAVGRTIRMNEHDVRVVGVAGGGFRGPERGVDTDVWLPLPALVPLVGFSVDQLRSRRSTMHNDIVLRPRPGVAPEAVETRVGQLVGRLAAEADGELGPYLEKLRPRVYPGLTTPPIVRRITQRSLRTLSGVVAVVLLIACAKVANLLLFRNVERRGSVAMRRALGASSMQVARQHLAQSLVLAVLGTLGGLGVGWLVALPFRGARLTRMPAFEGLALDGRTLLFAAVVAGATALLFGTVPALLAGRSDPASALRLARGRDTGRSGRLRSALSVGQLALSLSW